MKLYKMTEGIPLGQVSIVRSQQRLNRERSIDFWWLISFPTMYFQELAMRNALHIATYCPTLGDDILQLVVHQMLNIDVEVPRLEEGEEEEEEEDEEEEEGGEGEQEGTQFHVELVSWKISVSIICHCSWPDVFFSTQDDCLANGTASNGGCHDNNCLSLTASYSQQLVMANEAAEKLDVMMMVMFDHLHSICHTGRENCCLLSVLCHIPLSMQL